MKTEVIFIYDICLQSLFLWNMTFLNRASKRLEIQWVSMFHQFVRMKMIFKSKHVKTISELSGFCWSRLSLSLACIQNIDEHNNKNGFNNDVILISPPLFWRFFLVASHWWHLNVPPLFWLLLFLFCFHTEKIKSNQTRSNIAKTSIGERSFFHVATLDRLKLVSADVNTSKSCGAIVYSHPDRCIVTKYQWQEWF